jgi:hypothetical protein
MAFAYTVERTNAGGKMTSFGDMRFVYGMFTNGAGDTGGDIVTGLRKCVLYGCVNETNANAIKLVEAATAGTLTITTTAGDDGKWWAMGYT